MAERKIYDYRSNRDVHKLIRLTRRNSQENNPLRVRTQLSNGMVINTTPGRCLVNAFIFRTLDYWNIFDNRKQYIYTGSYLKGKPAEYMDKVLKGIERDTYFSNLPDDDFVIYLPHVLAEIKEHFYMMSTIVDGILLIDHSLYDYILAYRTCPEFKKIADGPIINESDAPWVVAKKLKDLIHKFKEEINIKPLSDFYRSGVKVNESQLMMFFCWGLVPNYLDMDKMLDYPVTGGVLNGYKTRKDIHLNDNVGILSLFTQKSEIKIPGKISKEFSVALGGARLNKPDTRETVKDCGTKRFQTITIDTAKDLAFYRYKYFKNSRGEYKEYIDTDRIDLIGKTLQIRSITTCDAEDVICEKCYGANAKFAKDTSIYKVNVNDYVLVLIAMILQGVISIKHYLGGILMDMNVDYLGVKYHLKDFIDKFDFVTKIDYNILTFKTSCKCELRLVDAEDKYETLFVDGEAIRYNMEVTKISDNRYKFAVPNDSVMRKAKNLMIALSSNNKPNPANDTGRPDFDIEAIAHMPITEQLMEVIKYLKDRIKLNHFIHYEIMAYSMTKDADNLSSRVTKDTKNMTLIRSNNVVQSRHISQSLSNTLPYGHINKTLSKLFLEVKCDEYDLLYGNIFAKDLNTDSYYREMNNMLCEAIADSDEYFNSKEGLLND